jgi:hypothetical protein
MTAPHPDLTWIVYVPGSGYEAYDTEAGALDAFQRAAGDLHAEATHEGWAMTDAECLTIYEAHPLRTFELEVTATPEDADEGWWRYEAEGRVVKHASTAAHNARMAACLLKVADACDELAAGRGTRHTLAEALPGGKTGNWQDIAAALRRLAGGEE